MKGVIPMGRRVNETFLASFAELDKKCCERFGIISGGITEYINRLNAARFAPGREEALPKLVRLRNLRNKMVHEPGAMRRVSEISKADVTWIKHFDRNFARKKDPISLYLRKARALARRHRAQRTAIAVCATLLVIAAVAVLFVTCSK